jgi:anti-sigma factor RsiW
VSTGPGPDAAVHQEVASYALGVLTEEEATRFEQHLAGCDICARELESFLPVVDLLADVRLSTVDMPPRPADVPGDELSLRRSRRSERRPSRQLVRRLGGAAQSALRRPAVAAALAAIAAAGVTVTVLGGPGPERLESGLSTAPASAATPWDRLRGPDLVNDRQLSATDVATGVQADAVLDAAPWGTRISFALSKVAGPLTCRLVAERRGGGTEVLSTWVVPADGYGTSKQPQPLVLQTATALPRAEIVGLRVESVAASGVRALVSVPA